MASGSKRVAGSPDDGLPGHSMYDGCVLAQPPRTLNRSV
jgi:hypothetical protein